MPADLPEPDHAATQLLTAFDALAEPGDAAGGVDLLLSDLEPPAPAPPSTPSATAAERSAHRAALKARPSGGGRAVLVVDGSAIARKFLMQRLQALGYEAYGAESGEEALERMAGQPFEIVFVEFVLAPRPAIDGLQLCQAIKQKTDHPCGVAPAVVIATGRVGSSDRVRGSLAGCDAYLTKPLLEPTLVAALAEVDPLFR